MKLFAIFLGIISIFGFFLSCWALIVMTVAEQQAFMEDDDNGE